MMMMDTDLMSSSSSARTGMDMLRSEAMMKVQLIIPVESAHNTITYLAQLGLLQFKDLNGDKSLVQRTYANQVKRCGEMARKLRFLHEEIQKAGLSCSQILSSQREIDLDKLETKLTEYEDELLEFSSNQEQLKRSHSELVEFELVLQKAGLFFPTIERDNVASEGGEVEEIGGISDNSSLLLEQEMQTIPFPQRKLGFITGLVLKAKVVAFERILFRATRGNMIFKYRNSDEHVTDLATGEKVEKIVFIVFFAGDWARLKVLKIAEAFGANLYPFPEQLGRQAQLLSEVSGSRSELQITIDAGTRHRNALLTTIGLELKYWNMIVQREKAVYHTLNMLSIDVTRKCLVAEGWCPEFAKPQIQNVLHRAALNSNSQVRPVFQVFSTDESPPTYFKTNKFTQSFQEMIDAYGVARYQEINPGVFTIITFPFLFGIMFGDWGHGIVLLLASLYIVLREAKLEGQRLGDIMGMLFGGRYVILLMSIFSIYCGLIYNEFFSRSFPLFGSSSYSCLGANCRNSTSPVMAKVHSLPYRFGVDPAWHGTQTELPFLNSLKMKLSILVGIMQMNLGLLLSYLNAKFFRSDLDVRYQVIPQVLFLNALFGYLCLLIIVKWCTGSKADLYHVMIYMFLSPTSDLGENELLWGQKGLQITLLLLAIAAVPWMLLVKPLILRHRYQRRFQGRHYGALGRKDSNRLEMDSTSDMQHEEFDFSEIFVHQLIHTIEFVLGAVSSTASYLRLWALSLAHAELSSVFYEKLLLQAWSYDSLLIKALGTIIFLSATVGVLLIMETLSAFLHTLRLHWVEFQNKFFHGDGYKFEPLSFATIKEDGMH